MKTPWYARLSQAELAAWSAALGRAYVRVRKENGGLFEARDPAMADLAGELFDTWTEVTERVRT